MSQNLKFSFYDYYTLLHLSDRVTEHDNRRFKYNILSLYYFMIVVQMIFAYHFISYF